MGRKSVFDEIYVPGVASAAAADSIINKVMSSRR
jgi:hypothetical protein